MHLCIYALCGYASMHLCRQGHVEAVPGQLSPVRNNSGGTVYMPSSQVAGWQWCTSHCVECSMVAVLWGHDMQAHPIGALKVGRLPRWLQQHNCGAAGGCNAPKDPSGHIHHTIGSQRHRALTGAMHSSDTYTARKNAGHPEGFLSRCSRPRGSPRGGQARGCPERQGGLRCPGCRRCRCRRCCPCESRPEE